MPKIKYLISEEDHKEGEGASDKTPPQNQGMLCLRSCLGLG